MLAIHRCTGAGYALHDRVGYVVRENSFLLNQAETPSPAVDFELAVVIPLKVGFGIFDFRTHISRLISKNRFPHPILVADAICGTRFDLRDSKRRALEN